MVVTITIFIGVFYELTQLFVVLAILSFFCWLVLIPLSLIFSRVGTLFGYKKT